MKSMPFPAIFKVWMRECEQSLWNERRLIGMYIGIALYILPMFCLIVLELNNCLTLGLLHLLVNLSFAGVGILGFWHVFPVFLWVLLMIKVYRDTRTNGVAFHEHLIGETISNTIDVHGEGIEESPTSQVRRKLEEFARELILRYAVARESCKTDLFPASKIYVHEKLGIELGKDSDEKKEAPDSA